MTATIDLSSNELHGLCQRYLKLDQNLVNAAATNLRDFKVLSYKLMPTSDEPTGFLGRHQFLCIKVLLKDGAGVESLEKLRFFSKSAPHDIASRMEYLEEFGVFKKEIMVYREVLPKLQQIFASVAPECYYADNNLLVFENLAEQGYKMAAIRDGILNYEHLNCALQTLASLHAASIVHEVRIGKKWSELAPDAIMENAYPLLKLGEHEHVRVQNFNNANLVLQQMIRTMPKYQSKLHFILEQFPKKMALIFPLAQTSTKYQNVFSHGDLWANNIMFQYGKFGDAPIKCRFVDFQLGRYAPPMMDLITLLTIPTSRNFRTQFLSELICNYYRFTSEFLHRENLDITDFMPKQEFYASAEEFRIVGLIESLLFSHLTTLPPTLTQQLTASTTGFSDFFSGKRIEICMEAFRTDQVYRERLTDMIEDFVDNFVLK